MRPMSPPSLASLALLASLATACSTGGERNDAAAGDSARASADAPAPPASAGSRADADLADLARYRLTMDKVDRYYAAQRRLFTKVKDMSPEEREALSQSQRANADANLDEMARNVERSPVMSAAVREAGLSAREYTMITMAMLQSAMAASVLKMRPNDNQDSLAREMKVNPENLRFLREHEAELAQKQKAMEAELKRLGAIDGG